MKHARQLTRTLQKRYFTGFIILLFLLAATSVALEFLLFNVQDDSRVINLSGRQRMLSQHIAKTTLLIQQSGNPMRQQKLAAELQTLAELLSRVHKGLQTGDEKLGLPYDNKSQEIRFLFERTTMHHKAIVSAAESIHHHFNENKTTNIDSVFDEVLEHEQLFLAGMDDITYQFAEESKAEVTLLAILNVIFPLSILIVLVAISWFVLRPGLQFVDSAVLNLQESEQRFRTLADNAPVMIWMAGKDGKYNFFNKTWLHFTGRPEEEEMGDGWVDGVYPEDREYCLDIYINSFELRKPFSMEYRLRRADGSYRWLLDCGSPRLSPQGEFEGYIGSCVDITELKEVAAKLKSEQELLSGILDSSNTAIFANRALRNAKGEIVDFEIALMNKSASEMVGMAQQELIGKTMLNVFPGIFEDGLFEKYVDVTENGTLLDIEQQYSQEGIARWFHIIATDFGDGFVAMIDDISDAKRAREELKESRLKLKTLIENFDDLVASCDKYGRLITCNSAFSEAYERATGKKPVTGERFIDNLPEDDREWWQERLERAIGGNSVKSEYHYDFSQAGRQYYEVYLNPIETDGEVKGFTLSSRNITKKIVYEKKLKRSKAKHKRLSEKLEKLNAAKDSFFSIIAHDLRTPFTALILSIENLLTNFDTLKSEKRRRLLTRMKDASVTTYDLLENLLLWSRSQMDSMKISPEQLRVFSVVDDLIKVSKHSADQKEITLETSIGEEDAIFADKESVATVLRNLLSNAIKFSTNKSVITIASEQTAGLTRISVKDSGTGISADRLDYLFDISRKFQRKGTNDESGSGLGLILCKELTEKNGGAITVSSKEAEGTTFTIILPNSKNGWSEHLLSSEKTTP